MRVRYCPDTHSAKDRHLPTRRLIWIKANLTHLISLWDYKLARPNAFWMERINWCQDQYGDPVLKSDLTLDYAILERGNMDNSRSWMFFDERFYFKDAYQAFEFKMRWL